MMALMRGGKIKGKNEKHLGLSISKQV